jgi:hypothetical protein
MLIELISQLKLLFSKIRKKFAMINCIIYGFDKKLLEAKDIAGLACRN